MPESVPDPNAYPDDSQLNDTQIREKNFVSCAACIAAISLLMQDAHGVLEGIGESSWILYYMKKWFKISTCSGGNGACLHDQSE